MPRALAGLTGVCLTCASGGQSRCGYGHEYVTPAAPDGSVVTVDVHACTCWSCDAAARVAVARHANGATSVEAAARDTHDFVYLEHALLRVPNEVWETTRVTTPSPGIDDDVFAASGTRVPVLYLRRTFLRRTAPHAVGGLLYDVRAWRLTRREQLADGGAPPWLRRVQRAVEALDTHVGDGGETPLLANVLCAFTRTCVFVQRHPEFVRRYVLERASSVLAERYGIDVPAVVAAAPAAHVVWLAATLRVTVAYELLRVFTAVPPEVALHERAPYERNNAVQDVALHVQLFADTHLDLCCVGHLAQRFDDAFYGASYVQEMAAAGASSSYVASGASPLPLRTVRLARFYPHPLRAPYAGELSSLGSPLHAGKMFNSHDVEMTRDALSAVLQLILSKTLNHSSMRRAFGNICVRNYQAYPQLLQLQLCVLECTRLGNYPGARVRPRWRARLLERRSFHFTHYAFEPAWCGNCASEIKRAAQFAEPELAMDRATARARDASGVTRHDAEVERRTAAHAERRAAPRKPATLGKLVANNECPHCDERPRAMWCVYECMRTDFVCTDTTITADQRIRLTDAAFRTARGDVASTCPQCVALAQTPAMAAAAADDAQRAHLALQAAHVKQAHACDACTPQPHTDVAPAAGVDTDDDDGAGAPANKRRRRRGRPPASSVTRHVCSACELLCRNAKFVFQATKEYYAYLVDADGVAYDYMAASEKHWAAYAATLVAGMNELRTLIDTAAAAYHTDAAQRRLRVALEAQIDSTHRFCQNTAHTLAKDSFMEMMRAQLESYKNEVLVNASLTSPQRSEDFLDNPALVLATARGAQLAEDDDGAVRRAHESLSAWRARGFTADDVRAMAVFVRELAGSDVVRHYAGSVATLNAVCFDMLRHVGFSDVGTRFLADVFFNVQVLGMPSNRVGNYVSALAQESRADFHILSHFCTCFAEHAPLRFYPLGIDAARAQMTALRSRLAIEPTERAPPFLTVRYVCTQCRVWCAPTVREMTYTETLTLLKDARVDGDAAQRVESQIGAEGTLNAYYNVARDCLVCSAKSASDSSSGKRFTRHGVLGTAQYLENIEEASSIRRVLERRDCNNAPLTAVNLLGVVVGLGDARHALCGVCGSLFQWRSSSRAVPWLGTVPDCGRHVRFGVESDRTAYTAVREFLDPYRYPARSGAWHAAAGGADDEPLTLDIIDACTYAAPGECYVPDVRELIALRARSAYRIGNSVDDLTENAVSNLRWAAENGWVDVTPSITRPRGVVESTAMATIATAFSHFPRLFESMSLVLGDPPSMAPRIGNADEKVVYAVPLTRFDTALARQVGLTDAYKKSFNRAALRGNDVDDSDAAAKHRLTMPRRRGRAPTSRNATPVSHSAAAALEPTAAFTVMSSIRSHRRRVDAAARVLPPIDVIRARYEARRSLYKRAALYASEALVCAYCGSFADANTEMTRLDVYDVDTLCANAYTRLSVLARDDRACIVSVYLCRMHFGVARRLLCVYPTPSSAVLFNYLRLEHEAYTQKRAGEATAPAARAAATARYFNKRRADSEDDDDDGGGGGGTHKAKARAMPGAEITAAAAGAQVYADEATGVCVHEPRPLYQCVAPSSLSLSMAASDKEIAFASLSMNHRHHVQQAQHAESIADAKAQNKPPPRPRGRPLGSKNRTSKKEKKKTQEQEVEDEMAAALNGMME